MTNLITHIDKCLLKWIWFNTNRRYKWHCCLLLFENDIIGSRKFLSFCKRSRCLEENPLFLFLSKKKIMKKKNSPQFASSLKWIWFNTNRRYKWHCCLLLFGVTNNRVYNDAFRTFTFSMKQSLSFTWLNHIHFNKHLSICVIRFVILSEKMC
jgi:hypothetical protein